jgi:enoyl-CoA hydratase
MTLLSTAVVTTRTEPIDSGVVAHVTIDNQRRLNTLGAAAMDALAGAFDALASEPDLRAVVLTGAGEKAFVGGADIGEMAALKDADEARRFITRLHRCCQAARELPVPVIARINGYALGAGLELAASCDLRIAARGALFGMPEVKLGVPSVIEAALLPRLVGWGRARQILLLGETFTAQEAEQWGLVERVVEADQLDGAVAEWIRALASASPGAVRRQKALMRRWEDLTISEAIGAGVHAFAEAVASGEPAAAMGAYLSRRRDAKD